MTHKSSHIIIKALMEHPDITPEQMMALELILVRDKFGWKERWAVAWMVYKLLG